MSPGRVGCCSPGHVTMLVTLLSTIALCGLAGPGLSLEASDAMDHYYFGGQLRGDTLPLQACNPDHDQHYLNCVMTLTDADTAISALEQLAIHRHVTATNVYFRPRDAALHNAVMNRAPSHVGVNNKTATVTSTVIAGHVGLVSSGR